MVLDLICCVHFLLDGCDSCPYSQINHWWISSSGMYIVCCLVSYLFLCPCLSSLLDGWRLSAILVHALRSIIGRCCQEMYVSCVVCRLQLIPWLTGLPITFCRCCLLKKKFDQQTGSNCNLRHPSWVFSYWFQFCCLYKQMYRLTRYNSFFLPFIFARISASCLLRKFLLLRGQLTFVQLASLSLIPFFRSPSKISSADIRSAKERPSLATKWVSGLILEPNVTYSFRRKLVPETVVVSSDSEMYVV